MITMRRQPNPLYGVPLFISFYLHLDCPVSRPHFTGGKRIGTGGEQNVGTAAGDRGVSGEQRY